MNTSLFTLSSELDNFRNHYGCVALYANNEKVYDFSDDITKYSYYEETQQFWSGRKWGDDFYILKFDIQIIDNHYSKIYLQGYWK